MNCSVELLTTWRGQRTSDSTAPPPPRRELVQAWEGSTLALARGLCIWPLLHMGHSQTCLLCVSESDRLLGFPGRG